MKVFIAGFFRLVFKVLVQLINGQGLLLCSREVRLDLAILEDDQPVAIGEGILEMVGDHQGRQVVVGDPFVGGVQEVQTGVGI